ncbi:winged helix-turn-helix transcriptional regulator [Leptospira sp. WS92.C1]
MIVRDIVYFEKKTFGEFLSSDERMATNILTNRLTLLEKNLIKKSYDLDRRKDTYELTEKGLDLIPILLELAQWGAQNDRKTKAPPV